MADHIAASGTIGTDHAREMVRRMVSTDFGRWSEMVRRAGYCRSPIRVHGSVTISDTGRLVYTSEDEPDRTLLIRCGNRRATACPSCSAEYKGDVWHLLKAGATGGMKGVPTSVAQHPKWFVTLTGPSFGAVHGDACGSRRSRSACPHGVSRCDRQHSTDDVVLGDPICSDCYDYSAAIAFNWMAPELWRRYTITARRELANELRITEAEMRKLVRLSYAKVAEFQRRGVVHFHAIVRLDGAGDPYEAPKPIPESLIADALRRAALEVAVELQLGTDRRVHLTFGRQVDVRSVQAAIDGDALTPETVAAYIAKYATKASEDFGLDSTIRTSAAARYAGLRDHVIRMIIAAESLSGTEGFGGIGRWLHMLGFRGHFTTKSRRFSTTLTAPRQARRTWREASDPADRSSCPEVDRDWKFAGLGYLNHGDRLLAESARVEAIEARWLSRLDAA
ncbi:replication initiator [Nakamurella lactea]|uniref:replication initiator n=1 Tax=Nakamurella lactea TaxID=459515 RepID=UPI0012B5BB32|nr:replication initiator [Nakamurella lactea]